MLLMYDLPGHGFSEGARAEIGDFSEYREQMGQLIDFAVTRGFRLHVVAHSTGAGVLADLLLHDKAHADMISSAVMIAPLLHSAHWAVSRTALGILPLESVRRSFRKNSSDESFKEFQKSDPLQYDRIPVSWTDANAAWAKRMLASSSEYEAANALFIQGNKDKVVDWKYNMKFYARKFPRGRFSIYEKARHQLMNESPQIIEILSNEIVEWLDNEQVRK
jgi:alpha-beta hydrolase superfamily lysophospholipase